MGINKERKTYPMLSVFIRVLEYAPYELDEA